MIIFVFFIYNDVDIFFRPVSLSVPPYRYSSTLGKVLEYLHGGTGVSSARYWQVFSNNFLVVQQGFKNLFAIFASESSKSLMFRFKQFSVEQELCAMKVGTDGVLLGAWAQGGKRILDIGTGTGLIALMMAQRNPASNVMAIDIDKGAVQQAIHNVEQSPFRHQIVVKQESVQEHQGQYESIVCNPPYFIDALHAPDLQRSIARHTDTLSYAELMQAAYRLLTDDGEFSVIVPFDYRKRMEDEAVFVGFFPHRVLGFRTSERKPIKRYLLSFVKHPMATENSVMTFGEEAYKELTKDFYL